jgi:hypothetical protein
LGLPVELSDALAEGAPAGDVVALGRRLTGSTAVLCSHGDVIFALLDALARDEELKLPKPYECAKGSTWELHARKGRFTSARYIPAPS